LIQDDVIRNLKLIGEASNNLSAELRAANLEHMGLAQTMVCLCSKQYEISPWSVGEMANELKEGKILMPI
jgi:uncharacterized protein with HEPN domain